MPDWLATLCSTYALSTPIIIIAVLAFLLNLYLNSDSKFARKPADTTPENTKPKNRGKASYNKRGQSINGVISIVSIAGILLAFSGC